MKSNNKQRIQYQTHNESNIKRHNNESYNESHNASNIEPTTNPTKNWYLVIKQQPNCTLIFRDKLKYLNFKYVHLKASDILSSNITKSPLLTVWISIFSSRMSLNNLFLCPFDFSSRYMQTLIHLIHILIVGYDMYHIYYYQNLTNMTYIKCIIILQNHHFWQSGFQFFLRECLSIISFYVLLHYNNNKLILHFLMSVRKK